jgi:hypothetical protein
VWTQLADILRQHSFEELSEQRVFVHLHAHLDRAFGLYCRDLHRTQTCFIRYPHWLLDGRLQPLPERLAKPEFFSDNNLMLINSWAWRRYELMFGGNRSTHCNSLIQPLSIVLCFKSRARVISLSIGAFTIQCYSCPIQFSYILVICVRVADARRSGPFHLQQCWEGALRCVAAVLQVALAQLRAVISESAQVQAQAQAQAKGKGKGQVNPPFAALCDMWSQPQWRSLIDYAKWLNTALPAIWSHSPSGFDFLVHSCCVRVDSREFIRHDFVK